MNPSRTTPITPRMIRGWRIGCVEPAPDDAGSVALVRVVRLAPNVLRAEWCSFEKVWSDRDFAAFIRANGCKALV